MIFKTPDVYIQEKSVFPPSVVTADTAVPAFIGYTEKAMDGDGNDLTNVPTRIRSLHEYESLFGHAEITEFNVTVKSDDTYSVDSPGLNYLMYHSLQFFYANGGGDCYIVSTGSNGGSSTAANKSAAAIQAGIDKLKAEDGPTLVVPVDAVGLVVENADPAKAYADYQSVCNHALAHCAAMQDRFVLFDVYQKPAGSKIKKTDDVHFRNNGVGINDLNYGAAYYPYLNTNLRYRYSDTSVTVSGAGMSGTLDAQTSDHYHNIRSLLSRQNVTLPPSAAIAGIIAGIDHSIGSWKAPANVSLNAVSGPAIKISNNEQSGLNVDASGKSINVIRTFNGKGTLVWGARTLAGNSNEWRYVPVRRLFLQMESDIKRSTSYAVFEPNTAVTWSRLRTQVQSYLAQLWRDGGLAGATEDEAFFVRIGLGETMDEQDILEGRLNITIGAAAVRPAEFVVITFTHKLQES